MEADAEAPQLARRGLGQPLRQAREHDRRRLDEADLHVAGEIDAVEPVVDQPGERLVQLGGELHAGGTRADDRHAQDLARRAVRAVLGLEADVEEALLQALGLAVVVEIEAMLPDSRHAEIVAGGADGDHQRVVGDTAGPDHLAPRLVRHGRQQHLPPRAVEALHAPGLEAESMGSRMAEVDHVVRMRPHGADRHLVQQRLPDMGQHAVDQRDPSALAPAEAPAEPGREHEPAGPAADDHDTVEIARQSAPSRKLSPQPSK